MIQYGKQSINNDDIRAVVKVLKSDWVTQGPTIQKFEQALARYCKAKYAVVVSNGTAALHLAYLAAGLRKGDEVIAPAMTFVATTNMLLAVGAKPVFCDIRKDNNNIDENKIEKLITKKTKAIIPVHFAGHPCEMTTIRKIAKKYNLLVIEDAAHALGARYKGKHVGSMSDMSTFSFHPVKLITTGEGGAILTDNKKYYEKLKLLRTHGIVKDKNGFIEMNEMGFNYRITDIQCALGVSQLKRLNSFIENRHEAVRMYEKRLKNVNRIKLPNELVNCYSAWHLYVIRTKKQSDRLPLYKYLLKNNIGVNFHYPVVYNHPFYKKQGYKKIKRRQAELYEKTAITLPLHTLLTQKEIKYISDKIKNFFENK